MLEAMSAWSIGLVVVMLLIGTLKIKASGLPAVLLMTVVPYGIGVFLFTVVR